MLPYSSPRTPQPNNRNTAPPAAEHTTLNPPMMFVRSRRCKPEVTEEVRKVTILTQIRINDQCRSDNNSAAGSVLPRNKYFTTTKDAAHKTATISDANAASTTKPVFSSRLNLT